MAPTLSRQRGVVAEAVAIGATTGAYGISFGALAITSGLSAWQTMALSLLMFTGASQFALVSVLAAGGNPVSAVATSTLLGGRNLFYALRMSELLPLRRGSRPVAAHLTIDESTAMALAHAQPPEPRPSLAFWSTGLAVFGFWNLGTGLGVAGAQAIGDPAQFGLDAAVPAAFLALLWPQIRTRRTLAMTIAAAVVALALTPVLQPGLPVLAAACVPLFFLRGAR